VTKFKSTKINFFSDVYITLMFCEFLARGSTSHTVGENGDFQPLYPKMSRKL